MSKKHWISLKRGLSEDPKHREHIGMAVWAFIHIIDRADWETGKVFDWRDKDEAEDMGMNERTLRDWRQKLESLGYIFCKQKQHGLEITIYNWINPRDYSGGVINPKPEMQGDKKTAPSEIQGDTQGDTQDDTQGSTEFVTPTLDSKTKGHKSKVGAARTPKKAAAPKATDFPEVVLFRSVTSRYPNRVNWDDIISSVKKVSARLCRDATREDLVFFFKSWTGRGYNPSSLAWLVWAETGQIPTNGNLKSQRDAVEPKGFQAIRDFLASEGVANG